MERKTLAIGNIPPGCTLGFASSYDGCMIMAFSEDLTTPSQPCINLSHFCIGPGASLIISNDAEHGLVMLSMVSVRDSEA